VKSIQYFLDQRGQSLVVDGDFGPLTQSGVKSFQTAEGLTSDGIVGAHTWPALIVQTSNGSAGDAVKALQSQIASRPPSSAVVAVDGVFGQMTQDYLQNFQRLLGLTVDGIAGPITWSYLVNDYLLASSPDAAAQAFYEAWTHDNQAEAGENATPDAITQLFAEQWTQQAGWTATTPEGAAGTIYYSWKATGGETLTIGVQDGAAGYFVAVSAQFQ
jgi:hypothetical protein